MHESCCKYSVQHEFRIIFAHNLCRIICSINASKHSSFCTLPLKTRSNLFLRVRLFAPHTPVRKRPPAPLSEYRRRIGVCKLPRCELDVLCLPSRRFQSADAPRGSLPQRPGSDSVFVPRSARLEPKPRLSDMTAASDSAATDSTSFFQTIDPATTCNPSPRAP